MKIFDCFMFCDEEMLLDIRLNTLNKFIDKFIIVESTFTHSGKKRDLVFDFKKFQKFKNKINYLVVEKPPEDIEIINTYDDERTKETKTILNACKRENEQRNSILNLLGPADPNDQIIISDVDEIPNLENINFSNIKNRLVLFKQQMFYYKFNLLYPSTSWFGSRACKKKNFISPQWLRNVRQKKYPLWRLDIFLSKRKYNNILYINNGGWHFTNIKSPENIRKKLLNYTHHYEFESSGLSLNDLKKKIEEKKVIYDHSKDSREYKWGGSTTLNKIELSKMPKYIIENYKKYINWLDL